MGGSIFRSMEAAFELPKVQPLNSRDQFLSEKLKSKTKLSNAAAFYSASINQFTEVIRCVRQI